MRSVLFILFLLSSLNLKAQELISLDYFLYGKCQIINLIKFSQDLIGPSIHQPTSLDEIYNIHLEYTFYVKRLSGVASTPFGSTFSGSVIMPIWLKIQDQNQNETYSRFLKPNMTINPNSPSIIPDCGVVDANWVSNGNIIQPSLNTAIITQSDFIIMNASAEVGEIIQSQINIDIQTPILDIVQPEGIYIYNDYSSNWINGVHWKLVCSH